MNIPYSRATLGKEEEEAVLRVLRSGWLAAGPETKAFEEEFSKYITPEGEEPYYCIFTNSGTAALKLAYKWFIEGGAQFVIYPKNTFCATYSAADEMGMMELIPREDCMLLSQEYDVRVNMHYGGVKEDFECDLEDSAHRVEPNDPLVGKIRIYSFYVTKNLTTGAGGMFVTKDKEIYERARLWWRDGLTTSTADRMAGFTGYRVQAMAGGYDGNDLAAAIGRVQLAKLPEFTKRRNEIARYFNARFDQQWGGNHLYPFFVKDEEEVYKLIAYLKERGVGASHNYPGTGWNGVSLPIYPLLTDEEAKYIADTIMESPYVRVQ